MNEPTTEFLLREKQCPWRPAKGILIVPCQQQRAQRQATKRAGGGILMRVCERAGTCEGSVTRSVTTSSLVYLMKRWCSSNSCIFHIRSRLSWSKNWKNLRNSQQQKHFNQEPGTQCEWYKMCTQHKLCTFCVSIKYLNYINMSVWKDSITFWGWNTVCMPKKN